MEKIRYEIGEDMGALSPSQLKRAGRETKKKAMDIWFRQNYSDPVDVCPYESAEGGYQFIWGGPYEPMDELSTEFSDLVPQDLIEEVAQELDDQAVEWSGNPDPGDDFPPLRLMEAIRDNSDPYSTIKMWLGNIHELLQQKVPIHLREQYDQLLFVNAITAFETFLSDTFTNAVVKDPAVLRKFIETNPEFKQDKFSLSEVYGVMETIESRVRANLADMLWHNIAKVMPMYKSTLNCRFPRDISGIAGAIDRRHNIVHRGGKTKDGQIVQVSKGDVSALLKQIESFAGAIDKQLPVTRPF